MSIAGIGGLQISDTLVFGRGSNVGLNGHYLPPPRESNRQSLSMVHWNDYLYDSQQRHVTGCVAGFRTF